jgi:hypothetical protein
MVVTPVANVPKTTFSWRRTAPLTVRMSSAVVPPLVSPWMTTVRPSSEIR